MKVILCEHVSNLGEMGETVNVADGYARNFLIPRKLAVSVESASARQIEHEMRIIRKREERVREQLRVVAKQLEEATFEFKARAGQDEKLFGSVTSAQIAEKLKDAGYDVDRRGAAALAHDISIAGEVDPGDSVITDDDGSCVRRAELRANRVRQRQSKVAVGRNLVINIKRRNHGLVSLPGHED